MSAKLVITIERLLVHAMDKYGSGMGKVLEKRKIDLSICRVFAWCNRDIMFTRHNIIFLIF